LQEVSDVGSAWLSRLEETEACEALLNPQDRKVRQPTDK
jgi:hypothetical protein